jgi:hypothetical protein
MRMALHLISVFACVLAYLRSDLMSGAEGCGGEGSGLMTRAGGRRCQALGVGVSIRFAHYPSAGSAIGALQRMPMLA